MLKYLTFLLTITFLFCSGCQEIAGPTEDGSGSLQIMLKVSDGRTKSFLPTIDMEPAGYSITVTDSNGVKQQKTADTGSVSFTKLKFGTYEVYAEAFNAGKQLIGAGNASTSVHAGGNTAVNITVRPLAGEGELALDMSWNSADVEYPTIDAELIPVSGIPLNLDFIIVNNGSAYSSTPLVDTGYYTLIVKLYDGNPANVIPVTVMGAVELVRIVKAEVTRGYLDFSKVNLAGGSISVTLTPELQNALDVVLTGGTAELEQGRSMTVQCSVPSAAGNITCVWYLNGMVAAAGQDAFTVQNLEPGVYRLDAVAYTTDGLQGGSSAFNFKVVAAPPAPEQLSPPTNLAMNNTGQGFPNLDGSDPGWGGGARPWDLLDGIRWYDGEWARGLAFTGGSSGYMGVPCGWRQVTINFGTAVAFNRIMVWHHGSGHIPNTYKIQYWDGANWLDIFSTDNGKQYLKYPALTWSTPTENTFPTVTSEKVRFAIQNCDIEHGWIYDVEVYKD